MIPVHFFVEGVPRGKGSWTTVPNKRTGRTAFIPAGSAKVRHAKKQWGQAVVAAAREAWGRRPPLSRDTPVKLTLFFYFKRPKSAKKRPWPTRRSTDDSDKLERNICDLLDTADVYEDDSQVCGVEKYTMYHDCRWGVEITVEVLE